MANRQLTVLNPGGYQELLQSADTLVVEGAVNMDSNNIGGLPAPSSDNDAARKKYIDDAIANVNLDLQGVTDNGGTTTNSITTAGATFNGNISANSLRLPEISGTYPLGYLEFGDPGASSNNGMRMGFSNTTSKTTINHLDTLGNIEINTEAGSVHFTTNGGTENLAIFQVGGANELYYDGTKRLATTNVAVDVTGILTVSEHVNIGATSNTSITSSSDGSGGYHTMLENSSTGDLYLRGTELYIQDNANSNQDWIHCVASAGVELHYDGDKAFETDAQGVSVYANYSTIPGLAGRINFGGSNNCRIEVYDNNAANSATNNNTFKIYSQHGANNTTKTSILYDGFFDQVWRTSGSTSGPTAELGRVNYDGGWELNYHDIQGSQGDSWAGTTCIKKLETTSGGVDVTGDLDVSGKLEVTGIDNGAQFNIKSGGEFFHFESTGAWHLVYDDSGSGSGWSYAIDATKDYVQLYGPGGSGSTIVLETKTGGVDVTGDLDVTGDVTATAFIGNGSQLTNLPASSTPTLQQVTTQGTSTTTGASFGGDVSTTGTVSAAVFDIDALTALP